MENKKLTVNKVALALDVSTMTISRWYKWYMDDKYVKPEDLPELPEYVQAGAKSVRYWGESDIEKMKIFQNYLRKGRNGAMGEFTKQFRSKKIKEKK